MRIARVLSAIGRFLKREDAAATVFMVICLPMFLALAGLAIDGAAAFRMQTVLQVTADAAAEAAALDLPDGATALATAQAYAVKNLPAATNGTVLESGDVHTGHWDAATRSFTVGGTPTNAVQVIARRAAANGNALPTTFLGLIGQHSWDISASAIAAATPGVIGCVNALNPGGTGLTMSGGASLSADACNVGSNSTVSVPCGTTIVTTEVDYYSNIPPNQSNGYYYCNGIVPPPGTAAVTFKKILGSDPLAGVAAIANATDRLTTVAADNPPAAPSVPTGTNVAFGYSASSTQSQLSAVGCSGSFSGSTWNVTCPNGGTYNFGNLTLSGGITVNLNTAGSPSTHYNFSGQINVSGTALHVGPGTFAIAKGIVTGGGSTTSFGAGTFLIGGGTSSCNGHTGYSLCNGGGAALSFAGPSSFVFSGGIYNSGGSTLTLGSGSTNSFDIGTASNGDSFDMGGGARTVFADATGGGDVFQFAGNLNVTSGGGSCLTLGAAAEHDVNGFFSTAGGTILGAGVYTVSDYVWLGGGGGGDVTCNGQLVGINGSDVTFVIGGTNVSSSGGCGGTAFCVASGYGHVILDAPTSGPDQNLLVIGPTTAGNTAGAKFTGGAGASMTGAFYFPNGPLSMSGGANVGSNGCLELIASQITLSGGATVASACTIAGQAGSNAKVAIVE